MEQQLRNRSRTNKTTAEKNQEKSMKQKKNINDLDETEENLAEANRINTRTIV